MLALAIAGLLAGDEFPGEPPFEAGSVSIALLAGGGPGYAGIDSNQAAGNGTDFRGVVVAEACVRPGAALGRGFSLAAEGRAGISARVNGETRRIGALALGLQWMPDHRALLLPYFVARGGVRFDPSDPHGIVSLGIGLRVPMSTRLALLMETAAEPLSPYLVLFRLGVEFH